MAAIFGAIPFILPEDVRVTVWLLLLAMTTLAQVSCGHAHDQLSVPFRAKATGARAVKSMMERVHQILLQAGMPEDRIDYILTKWVQYVYPESFGRL